MFLNVSTVSNQVGMFKDPEARVWSNKIILAPGNTFRNITNNTRAPMDITKVVEIMAKQH